MLFRGRELAHIDEGRRVMDEVLAALEEVGKVEKNPSMEGKRMTAIVAPRAGVTVARFRRLAIGFSIAGRLDAAAAFCYSDRLGTVRAVPDARCPMPRPDPPAGRHSRGSIRSRTLAGRGLARGRLAGSNRIRVR